MRLSLPLPHSACRRAIGLAVLLLASGTTSGCAGEAPASNPTQNAGSPDLASVPAELHACLPPYVLASTGQYFETARLTTSDGVRVLVETLDLDDPADTNAFRPTLLGVGDEGCEAYMGDAPLSPYVLASYVPQYADLTKQRYRWRAERYGGPDAFATAWAAARAPRPATECADPGVLDTDGDCVPWPDAAALRSLGIDIARPGGAPTARDTTELTSELFRCLPPAVRARANDAAEITRVTDDSTDYVLVHWSPTDGSEHTALLQVRGDVCESLLPEAGDIAIEDVAPPAVADALAEARLDDQITRAGGLDAYADVLRTEMGGTLRVCSGAPETWSDCLSPPLATRLRARGLDIAP